MREIDFKIRGYNKANETASNGDTPERTLDKDKVKEAIKKSARKKGK